ncbi:MAG: hypothetical protein M1820_004813 [Bogoriella megaspora]|nr:MAG: hypothetical protein M1820_004813 [Bogoriella megaspora]
MGFTTGFIGGLTLTTSVLYVTLSIHRQNRLSQSAFLRNQAIALNNFSDPQPLAPPPTARETRLNWSETWKDRWNTELENGVRRLYAVNWNEVRDDTERAVARAWESAVGKAREEASKAEEGK